MQAATDHPTAPRILGRAPELARIGALLDAVAGDTPRVLVLTGEPGAGKSTLVDWAADQARARGLRTLRVRGCAGEAGLGLSGLHQLLHPLLPGIDRLPELQRAALRCAFGLAAAGAEPVDPLHLRVGVVTLLTEAAARQPVLLIVDDMQWLDLVSLDLLAFVARRLADEPVGMLLAARDAAVPERFDRHFPQLVAGPLDRATAGLLLDQQPNPPQGRARSEILDQAAGNPLALIELARALASGHGGSGTTLPLTTRLERLFAADLPGLPAQTRAVLVLAASAGTIRLADLLRAADGVDVLAALAPAERAGLVRVEDGQVLLRHPLVRSAICQAATFAERRAAHLALADAEADDPDRRAWHLAAASPGPDEAVADALARSAARSAARGGHAAAAAALERAADLTPDQDQRVVRLLAAARSAMLAGHPQWVGEITARVAGHTEQPLPRAEAALLGGWALGVTRRHDEALAALLPVGESMAVAAPELAIRALGTAAVCGYNSGDPSYRAELQRLTDLVPANVGTVERAWIEAAIHPHTHHARALALLDRAVAASPAELADLTELGWAAWALDDPDRTVRLLGAATGQLRRASTAGSNATIAQTLALAHTDAGGWAAARASAEDAFLLAAEAGADNITVGARLIQATLAAFAGEHAAARAIAQDAVRGVDLRRSLSLQVRYRYALGMAAFVAGEHADAYEQLRATFSRDPAPQPVHYHASVYYLADLASVAVRVGQERDAAAVLASVRAGLGADPSVRVRAIVHRAAALLGTSADSTSAAEVETNFLAALAEPATAGWPFEQASTLLEFGEWLRRRRRTAEARTRLTAAQETFRRLEARPWLDRTGAELRAAGVPGAAVPAAGLTPQELRIAELAATGLTNRDIAAQVQLSPRTVGYHLHKIFPKLGVRTRAQLRDALAAVITDADSGHLE